MISSDPCFRKMRMMAWGGLKVNISMCTQKKSNKNESFNHRSNILGYPGMSFEEEHVFFFFNY